MENKLKNISAVEDAKIIYSMWDGYLTEGFKDFCHEKGLVLESAHTSGHAELEDLKKFANALNPKKLILIHTFEREKYSKLFENVQILEDREVLEL